MPFGRGFGRGFGFRGYSRPWPHVGLGRGGLPRCYAVGDPGYVPPYHYGMGGWYPYPEDYGPYGNMEGMSPYGPSIPPEQEVEFLKDQAQMLKQSLDYIDARIRDLEGQT